MIGEAGDNLHVETKAHSAPQLAISRVRLDFVELGSKSHNRWTRGASLASATARASDNLGEPPPNPMRLLLRSKSALVSIVFRSRFLLEGTGIRLPERRS